MKAQVKHEESVIKSEKLQGSPVKQTSGKS